MTTPTYSDQERAYHASTDPWRSRAIEIRGRAQTVTEGGERLGPGFGPDWIRITPIRVLAWVAWGFDLSGDTLRSR